jgi:rhomboid family GlyGly-CTERM serine protease
MPGDRTSRAEQLAAALQWDRGRWIWLLLIVLFLHAVLALGDSVTLALRYDRAALGAGAWWRLLTAHIVHLNLHHLLLDELGLVLMWALFAQDFDAVEWCVIVSSGALAISSGLWWLSPGVSWYVGVSGVLHTVLGAGTAQHLLARAWDRWLLLLCLVVKIALEQYWQWRGDGAPGVVVNAHLYGATAGLVVGAVLCARMAIIRHRIRP